MSEDIYITCDRKSNPFQNRVDAAKSLFGILPADITLEEAQKERLEKIREPSSTITITNTPVQALEKVQNAFAGLSEKLGVSNENEVQELIDEVRSCQDIVVPFRSPE